MFPIVVSSAAMPLPKALMAAQQNSANVSGELAALRSLSVKGG